MSIRYYLWKKSYQLLFTIILIGIIVAFSTSLHASKNELFHTAAVQMKTFGYNFLHLSEMTIEVGIFSKQTPLWSYLEEPFVYSFIILSASFICVFMLGILFSYGAYLLSPRMRKIVKECLFFLQSIPDVMFIFAVQLFIIWLYKKTNFLIVDPVAGLKNIYLLPILVVSILPGIMLFQMTFLAIEEESKKAYVEFAKAKGLSNGWILLKHILRNVVVTLFSHSHYLFWLLVSNLLVVELLFNIHGYFQLLYSVSNTPDVFFVCLVALFLPFFFIEVVFNLFAIKVTGKEQSE
ncbi:ABC transporter permease subunit [Bacillus sp. EAC]|uniref:ABC transporter permease subunit n=1 Tax=Bacillus sp. EAC TaxID=1978338 RepID=UPI000B434708|nr:ABC transporter permease subunit [Bacillus sp. EAC]